MKKLVLSLMAGVIIYFTALPAFAVDLKFNGNFRVRGFYTDNLDDQSDASNDASAYNSMRFLLTATASAGVGTGVVTMDFTTTNNTGNQRFGETPSYGPQDRSFALLEAYLKADLRVAELSAGRRAFKIGHGIIFEDPVDGFFLDMPLGPARLTLVNAKPFDCSDQSATNNPAIAIATCPGFSTGTGNDTDLYFGNLAMRAHPELGGNVFIGLYKDRGPNIASGQYAAATQGVDLWIFGATVDAVLDLITLTGEIDYLTGDMERTTASDPSLDGLNIHLGGNANVGPANVGLGLFYASGDNPSNPGDVNINGIDGNFPIGIILTNGGARSLAPKDGTCLSANGNALGGIPNCVNGAGIKAVKASASMSPVERLTLQGDVIYARASSRTGGGANTEIGWELDGVARYQLDDNFSIMAGIGYLITRGFFQTGTTSPDDQLVAVGEMSFHF